MAGGVSGSSLNRSANFSRRRFIGVNETAKTSVVRTTLKSESSPVRALDTRCSAAVPALYAPAVRARSDPYTNVREMIRSMSYRR